LAHVEAVHPTIQNKEKIYVRFEKQNGNNYRTAMLIGASLTWQQRLLFVSGIAFGLVVEALPYLFDRLKEALTERWRLLQVVKRPKAA
jgi:hypothetical protein